MQSLKSVELLLLEAQLGHVELQVRLVEETQDDLLAEEGRQDRDPEVHLLAAPSFSLMRPSWGRRRSAMSSSDMILMREVSAFFSLSGGFMTS